MTNLAKEQQNQIQFDTYAIQPARLGPYTTHIWNHDPRHLGFLLARYKFVAKMLEGKAKALEIGCGDGFGMPVVAQTVNYVHGIDFEPLLLNDNQIRLKNLNCSFSCMDITQESPAEQFDCAYSLDVIEHIPSQKEDLYFKNISSCLEKNGILIVGTPNVKSQEYASPGSQVGHINLKSHLTLKESMQQYFENVFSFSMNDEVVHTGFGPMAHYLFAMGVGVKVVKED